MAGESFHATGLDSACRKRGIANKSKVERGAVGQFLLRAGKRVRGLDTAEPDDIQKELRKAITGPATGGGGWWGGGVVWGSGGGAGGLKRKLSQIHIFLGGAPSVSLECFKEEPPVSPTYTQT